MRKNRTVMSAVLVMMMAASWPLSVTPVASANAAAAQTTLSASSAGQPMAKSRAAASPSAGVPQEIHEALVRNQGHQEEKWRFIPSTSQSVIFTFGGLSKKEPLVHVLDAMKANEMRGTFFVTERELKRNAENIRLVRS